MSDQLNNLQAGLTVAEFDKDPLYLLTRKLVTGQDEAFTDPLFNLLQRQILAADYINVCITEGRRSLREQCVKWILELQKHHGFSPVIALLSVNYCDRILSSIGLDIMPRGPDQCQLLSVACLSLAVKMEEKKAPSPLTMLRRLKPTNVFNLGMYIEVEIAVLSRLQWNLRSLTPFDFIAYFFSTLPEISALNLTKIVVDVASDILQDTCRFSVFLKYDPSVIAAATVLWATFTSVDFAFFHGFFDKVNQELVLECYEDVKKMRGGQGRFPSAMQEDSLWTTGSV